MITCDFEVFDRLTLFPGYPACWKVEILRSYGEGATEQRKAAQKALVFACAVCKAQMPDPKTYKQHFENKHPKNPIPKELEDVV
ncbi:hypothetical protein GE061_011317 [Apolygus lucorum]|uniref:Uncharacterized protein n=1 Tax=Apolygus lucorum TaxID=248454 RepID=A0A8S9XZS2_APOLU|nr:hypothetical protein GE061_011317 [Apolygus lucorum]